MGRPAGRPAGPTAAGAGDPAPAPRAEPAAAATDGAGEPTPAPRAEPAAAATGDTAPAGPPEPRAAHPGPARVAIPAPMLEAIATHARAEYPNEACGLVAGTAPPAEGGTPTTWRPARNRAASPLRYEIDPEDLLRISLEIDDAGDVIWGIAHSHVRSPARPSPTDVGLAFYPDALYLIVSLTEGEGAPAGRDESVRAWRIVDRGVFEVALDIDG